MGINVNKLTEKMFDNYKYCLESTDCKDLSEDIITIVNETSTFNTPLQEWINGKRTFTDVEVNGFSLVELAYRLDNKNPNIPIATIILWLESKDDLSYHGLAAVADYICLVNPQIILGEQCGYAVYKDETWYFMLDSQKNDDLKKCQAWQVLLLNPKLILQVAYEHPNNTSLTLLEDGSYLIIQNEEV